jgi:cytoplasmic iron level regulating protein YaaA (DUF328/UPF0246 family)
MITILSPAKSMDFTPIDISEDIKKTLKSFSKKATLSNIPNNILHEIQKFEVSDLMALMKVSEKIAKLNFDRFQNFDKQNDKEAILAYNGDVYNNLDKDIFFKEPLSIKFAHNHLRIISGLYGALKPFDRIKPYRLEMLIKIPKIAPKGLSKIWSTTITETLNKELNGSLHKDKIIINAASKEYSSAIDRKILNFPIIDIHFLEMRSGVERNIPLNSKRARGMFADFIIKNQID